MKQSMKVVGQWIVVVGVVLALHPSAQAEGVLSLSPSTNVSVMTSANSSLRIAVGHQGIAMAPNGDFVLTYFVDDGIVKREFYADTSAKDASDVVVDAGGANATKPAVGYQADGKYIISWGLFTGGSETVRAAQYNLGGGSVQNWNTLVMGGSGSDRKNQDIGVYSGGGAFILGTANQHDMYGSTVSSAGAVAFGGSNGAIIEPWGWTALIPHSIDVAVVNSTGHAVIFGGETEPGDPATNKARYNIYDSSAGTFSAAANAATTGNVEGKDGTFYGLDRLKWVHRAVAMNDAGQGVMVWMDNDEADTANQNTTGNLDIYARRFTLSGTTLTFADAAEFLVNTTTTDDQFSPDVAINSAGQFVIVWGDDDRNVYGRFYNPDGTSPGAVFQLNEFGVADADDVYLSPRVAMSSSLSKFAVSFAFNPDFTDGDWSDTVLFAREFDFQVLVPEPSVVGLLALGAALVARRIRKK